MIEIGWRFDNRPLTLPWPACPHILLGGQTGSGKSGVTNAVIGAVAERSDTAICGIDLKLVEQWLWRGRMTTCATTTAEADKLLADLRALIQYRAKLLQSLGLRMWTSGPRAVGAPGGRRVGRTRRARSRCACRGGHDG